MREIDVSFITQTVKQLFIDANYSLNLDICQALKTAKNNEESEISKDILNTLILNYKEAKKGVFPLCQDTGLSVIFIESGQDIHFINGSLNDAINEGVRQAYSESFLRKSIVSDPLFDRTNTRDNTPAIVHHTIVSGESISLTVLPKGGGSENMSQIKMLKPNDGEEGLISFVKETILSAGTNPCPPIIIGIGIGGNFETSALLAKKSLLRSINEHNPDNKLDELEKRILHEVNQLNIGPMGFGGKTTALAVHILTAPCHIASLPVAINIECHAHRYKKVFL